MFKYSKERSKRQAEINLNSLPFSHVQEVGCLIYNQNYLLLVLFTPDLSVHDLLREFILSKIVELNFCEVLEKNSSFHGKNQCLPINNCSDDVLKANEK